MCYIIDPSAARLFARYSPLNDFQSNFHDATDATAKT